MGAPLKGERLLLATDYQVNRSANCINRPGLPEFRVLKIPVVATPVGSFGLLSTLKKSTLKRILTRSVKGMVLNRDAS